VQCDGAKPSIQSRYAQCYWTRRHWRKSPSGSTGTFLSSSNFFRSSHISAHLVSHHHHLLTPFPPHAVRLSKIVFALPPMMPHERAHRKIRMRPSCSKLRGIIPQQIAFAMLPLRPLRFPLTNGHSDEEQRPRERQRYRGDSGCFGGWDVRQWLSGARMRARVRSGH
jgi:hypothetical protein